MDFNTITMTRKDKILNSENFQLRLSSDLKEQFRKAANKDGEVMSTTLRNLIKKYIKENK